jgi:hypothetical protein
MGIKIKETMNRLITPSGMLLVGALLEKTNLALKLNELKKPPNTEHQNAVCVFPYIGLLCQGKTEYDDINEMHEDKDFYRHALYINTIPSEATMRQRLDELGFEIAATDTIMEESAAMLRGMDIKPTPCFTGHVPLDVDVSVHDNSKTKKEGVERTYKGVDGYAPIYAYIGEEGYACNVELREGGNHSQCEGTVDFFTSTLRMAKQITDKKILVRLDSGNDSIDNIKLFNTEKVDFLIKRNLRNESLEKWHEIGIEHGTATHPREGKSIYTGSIYRDRGLKEPLRIVFEITVRTILANGQLLLEPRIEADTWWTSLERPENDVIRLYREHATCEQFHSEIKSDIGLERFPSGKFDTNAAILKLAMLAYNILRVVGQGALRTDERISRKNVKRIRAKTVINRFMFMAGRLITHARQTFITFGRSNMWSNIFTSLYLSYGGT